MKQYFALLLTVCLLVACHNTQDGITGEKVKRVAYFKGWSSVVSDGVKTCYVVKNQNSKRLTIYNQDKQALYDTKNNIINLCNIHDGKLYFLDAKMKKNWALDYKVLDLKTLQVETIFKLPRDNYSFINPIFYNGYVYWQDTGYEANNDSNSLIYLPIYTENGSIENNREEIVWEKIDNIFIIGIVNDRVYYAYDPNNKSSDRVDKIVCVIASCNLDGSDQKILISEESFGESFSFNLSEIIVDSENLYVLVETGKGKFIVRINISTLNLEKFPIVYSGYLSAGKDYLYLNTFNAIYKINKEDMSIELFLDKYVNDLVVAGEYLYFKLPQKVLGKKHVDKLCRIKIDGTGFEILDF